MIDKLNSIVGRKVEQLYLVVWPPLGESSMAEIDISVGYVFQDNLSELFIVTTDKNDLTIPFAYSHSIPNKSFSWKDFEYRMKNWMDGQDNLEIEMEYYEVTNINTFRNIIGENITDVELVKVIGNINAFGTKIIFKNDYVLSTPITDGNTIETNLFNQNNNIKNFLVLGEIEYISIKNNHLR